MATVITAQINLVELPKRPWAFFSQVIVKHISNVVGVGLAGLCVSAKVVEVALEQDLLIWLFSPQHHQNKVLQLVVVCPRAQHVLIDKIAVDKDLPNLECLLDSIDLVPADLVLLQVKLILAYLFVVNNRQSFEFWQSSLFFGGKLASLLFFQFEFCKGHSWTYFLRVNLNFLARRMPRNLSSEIGLMWYLQ